MPDEFLKSVVDNWDMRLENCRQTKTEQFGRTAKLLWAFMGKSYRDLYLERDALAQDLYMPSKEDQGPTYKARVNKCREFVSVVMPFVHARVPDRLASPRAPEPPGHLLPLIAGSPTYQATQLIDQMTSWLMTWYLNYIPGEYNAYVQQRRALPEALVKGRGVVWHEIVDAPSGPIPASIADTVDGLLIEPDSRTWEHAGYIIRKRWSSAHRLAARFGSGITPEALRKAYASAESKVEPDDDEMEPRDRNDTIEWYEVYSRVGLGKRLRDASDILKQSTALERTVESLGGNIYLAFVQGYPAPLNLPEDVWLSNPSEAELQDRLEWPIPFWADAADNPWPCTPLDIYPNVDNPWATAPLEGSMCFLVFLDHLYSFLMSRARNTAGQLIVAAKSLKEDLQQAIAKGLDLTLLFADEETIQKLDKLIHVVERPELHEDVWKIIPYMERAFESMSGITPLLIGAEPERQSRSAADIHARQAGAMNRPEDYAEAVEQWQSRIATKECQAARMLVKPHHVAGLFRENVPMAPEGEDLDAWANPEHYGHKQYVAQLGLLSRFWGQFINTADPREAAADIAITVEAGSGRRKNRQLQQQQLELVMQALLPIAGQFALAGQPMPLNTFVQLIGEIYQIPLGRLQFPALVMMPEPGQEEEAA